MARRVLMVEVGGERVQGRPRLGWMDGAKMALASRAMMVATARKCTKDRKEWRALVHKMIESLTWPFLLGLVFFQTALQRSGGFLPGEGWDAVT